MFAAGKKQLSRLRSGGKKMEGTVKFYNRKKGFGFISGDDGTDFFVHVSALPGGLTLRDNDRVSFDASEGERGPKAENIQLLEKASEREGGDSQMEETYEAQEEAPVEESSEDEATEAPAEESGDEETAEEPSEDAGDEATEESGNEESGESEEAPAEEPSEDAGEEEAPAEESSEDEAAEEPSEDAGSEEAPAEEEEPAQ